MSKHAFHHNRRDVSVCENELPQLMPFRWWTVGFGGYYCFFKQTHVAIDKNKMWRARGNERKRCHVTGMSSSRFSASRESSRHPEFWASFSLCVIASILFILVVFFSQLVSLREKNTGKSHISWENLWFPVKIFPFSSTHWMNVLRQPGSVPVFSLA